MSSNPNSVQQKSPTSWSRSGIRYSIFSDTGESSFNVPSYQRGTISSQSDDVNQETDKIQRAFDANAWISLKQIEHEKYLLDLLKQGVDDGSIQGVESADMQHLRNSIGSRISLSKQPISGSEIRKKGTFSEYEYVPDPMDERIKLKKEEEEENRKKILEIGKGKDWRPVKTLGVKSFDIYPHLDDPFEALENEELRQKSIERAKRLAGDFKPSGKSNRSTVTRAMFDDILEDLYYKLESDWKDDLGEPSIWIEKDLILIFFKNVSTTMRGGLTAYMNMLPNDGIISKYKLSRVIKRWNRDVSDQVLYTFKPPWVALNENFVPDEITLPHNLTNSSNSK